MPGFSGEGSQPSGTSEDTTLSNMARAVQVHPDANQVRRENTNVVFTLSFRSCISPNSPTSQKTNDMCFARTLYIHEPLNRLPVFAQLS